MGGSLERFQCAERSLAVKVDQKRMEVDKKMTVLEHETKSWGHSMGLFLSDHDGALGGNSTA